MLKMFDGEKESQKADQDESATVAAAERSYGHGYYCSVFRAKTDFVGNRAQGDPIRRTEEVASRLWNHVHSRLFL
jgi:hypothetical protein